MIQDTQTIFSGSISAAGVRSAQAITATAISTNVLDTRNAATPAAVDEGLVGGDLWLVVQVSQVFNNLTSLAITLESSAAAGLTSATVHFSQSVLLAALTAGATVVRVKVPSGDYLRYLGLRYTVTGTNPSTGSLFAFLTPDVQRNLNYPSGFTVDA